MRLLAPAKINLHLRVGPASPSDGYHPVLTWMSTVGLFDTLTLERSATDPHQRNDTSRVRFTCDDPTLATDSRNLVVRAAELALRDEPETVNPNSGVQIHLAKRIPAGAGLGGGSSDAARTLLGVSKLLGSNRSSAALSAPTDLSAAAATLGSDVPFFLFGPSSICTGRGEIVQPIARPKPQWAVLILPELHVSTPAVYRRFDEMKLGDARAISADDAPDWNEWSSLDARDLLSRLVNDLEAPAFSIAPQLATLRNAAEVLVQQPVRMSGSGSSLFTLFDDDGRAANAAKRLSAELSVRVEKAEVAPRLNDDLMN